MSPKEPCVLVVDDDKDIRETMREVVEIGGCRAVFASNGKEGLELMTKLRPCLTIVDLVMPVMTGDELLARVRSTPDLADLKVVVSTSLPQHAPAGVPVLPKPIDVAVLWDWMRRACACA
jgi:two-component system chemotaxis response regulator CheY